MMENGECDCTKIHSVNNMNCFRFHLQRWFSLAIEWAPNTIAPKIVCILNSSPSSHHHHPWSTRQLLIVAGVNANGNFRDNSLTAKPNRIREHQRLTKKAQEKTVKRMKTGTCLSFLLSTERELSMTERKKKGGGDEIHGRTLLFVKNAAHQNVPK